MARQLRLVFPGALYHVTGRGNNGLSLFDNPAERLEFLALLELSAERFGWIVHGYCLMGNHYHLLIETPRGNLSIGMKRINSCYARYLNARRRRVGHIFQGRFKSVLVEKDGHLLEAIRYLALNPVRTDPPLVERPEQWPWGSYRVALGLAPQPDWLRCEWTLAQFARDYEGARARLRQFVDGLPPEVAGRKSMGDGMYFASAEFVASKTKNLKPIPEIPRPHWQPLRPTLEHIFARKDAIAVAYRDYGYTLREIADHLGCHYSTVSRHLRRAESA